MNDHVDVGNDESLNITTLTLFVRAYLMNQNTYTTTSCKGILTKGGMWDRTGGAYQLYYTTSNNVDIFVRYGSTSADDYVAILQDVAPNNWANIFSTINVTKVSLFIDGDLVNTRDLPAPVQKTSAHVFIGSTYSDGTTARHFKGIIKVAGIVNRVLSEEQIKLLNYMLPNLVTFDENAQIQLIPTSIPIININSNQTAVVQLAESTTALSAFLPIPVGVKNVNPARWVYTADGSVLQFDDNRYINATSVTFEIPLQIHTSEISTIPSELILDSNIKTYRYEAEVNIYNPSDIDLIGVIGIDPSDIGVANAYMNDMFMAYNNGLLTNAAPIKPGHNQFKITAELPLEKKEVEFRATIDDYLNIDTFDEAVKAAQALAELKTDTIVKVITIETVNFEDYGNRTVIIPLKGVKASDVIEAKALTGSRPDIEVRKAKDGCELVIPPSAFTGDLLDYNKAEIKLIYLKKPAWWEKIPFLKNLGGFLEFLKKLFGGG